MGLYKNLEGRTVEADDQFAQSQGWEPLSDAEHVGQLQAQALADRQASEAESAPVTFLRHAGSMATLGGTDVLTANTITEQKRGEILAGEEAHPIAATAGDVVGAIGPAFAAPGSVLAKTPAGYLSQATARMAEGGGAMAVIGAAGTEGAIQNAGQYIGHAALEDKDATVEGLAGALGTGFAFGAAGGGAAVGVEKGTIAARRMFSRVMDGGKDAAATAASEWETASKTRLDADQATADAARKKLEEYRSARVAAQQEDMRAASILQDEKVRASTAKETKTAPDNSPVEMVVDNTLEKLDAEAPGPRRVPSVRNDGPQPFTGNRPVELSAEGDLPTIGAEAPGPRRVPKVDTTEPANAQVQPFSERTKVGPTGEPVSLGEADIHSLVKEMQRRSKAGENLRGLNPNETLSEFRARQSAENFDAMPRTLDIQPAGELKTVKQQQSVAGLKNIREAFGKLTRTEPSLGGVIDKESAALESALAEFESAKAGLLEHIQTPAGKNIDMTGMRPAARSPNLAGDISRFEENASQFADKLPRGMPDEFGAQGRLNSSDATAVKKTPNKQKLRQLDDAHEAALARAQNAATDAEREAAMSEAKMIEQQLGHEALPDNFVGDVAKAADAFNRYEKAAADLAEATGDAAHPVSKEAADAWSKANDESVRKTMDRITRSAEDAETFGVEQLSSKERVANAKQYKTQTASDLSKAREAEFAAKEEARTAKQNLSATKKEVNANKPKTSNAKKGAAAEAAGIYEMMDIPGMPKAGDIPVVGPFLSAWLKFRAVKAALGRFTGRIPATADARVAALAAKTKDKVATSIDRALGLAENTAIKSRKVMPTLTTTLERRIYDIGEQHKKDADIREKAALRIRELAAYVNTPGAIEQDVRRELRGVTDPDIIAAAEKHRRAGFQYLLDNAPKLPPEDALAKTKAIPSAGEALSFARRLEAWHDPDSVFDATANGTVTKEAADTLRATFPRLFELGQKRLLMQAGQLTEPVPYRQRVMMSILYDVALDKSLDPRNIRIIQESFKPTGGAQPAGTPPMAPPTPSLAGDVALNALYQTASDRSSLRR